MTIELMTAIGALLAGASGIISAIVLNRKTQALMEYRLTQVEERLDKHNHYAEKLGDIAISIARIQEDIKFLREK